MHDMDQLDSAGQYRRQLGAALTWLFALVPIVPVAIGIVLLNGSAPRPAAGGVIHPFVASTPAPLSAVNPVTKPVAQSGYTVAVIVHATTIRSAPNGPAIAPQPLKTTFGSPTVLLVRQVRPGWLGVVSPLVGNGRLGWLPISAVSLAAVNWQIDVSLHSRQLTVLEGKRVRERYRIAIGRATAPTPTGYYAVTDRLTTGDPSGPYGCCIIAISALAPHAIQGWGGGNRIAIHSTPPDTYWSIGQAISHGCIHVTLPQGQWLMDHIPLGTPTLIRS